MGYLYFIALCSLMFEKKPAYQGEAYFILPYSENILGKIKEKKIITELNIPV